VGTADAYLQLVSSTDEAGLASQLAQIAAQMQIATVTVGLTGVGQRLCISVGADGRCTDRQTAQDTLIYAGCLAKPLTATLIADAVAEGQLHWHDGVAKTLGADGATATQLDGVTVLQLLNHTHGLDASSLKWAPRTAEGLIDTRGLCEALGARRLATPGDLYSYSDVGAWLAGAVLEATYRESYLGLLSEKRIVHDCDVLGMASLDVCPSTGGSLRLAAREWLEFLETHTSQIVALANEQVALPGWGLLELGACPGWKSYAGGWLGHNSNHAGCAAVLRFHPRAHVGIIASAAAEGAAMLVLSGLLGHLFPELFTFRMPRALAKCDVGELQLNRYTGSYTRSDTRLDVTDGRDMTLSVTLHARDASSASSGRQLHAGRDSVFVPQVRDDPELPFLQFLRPDATGTFEYAWNGKQLWRRE
jgi:CubicO group peptidase (beta-lactamase class C family)